MLCHLHITWQESETALYQFPSLGLPSTLIRHKNGDLRKRSSNQEIWKRRLCVLVKNILKAELPEKDELQLSWFARDLLKYKYNWIAGDRCVFKFLLRSVDGKHFIRFRSETSVFKFLRNSVDIAWVSSTRLGLWDQVFRLERSDITKWRHKIDPTSWIRHLALWFSRQRQTFAVPDLASNFCA